MMLLSVFTVMCRSQLIGILRLGFRFTNHNEAIVFQFTDLLLFEVAYFWFRVRAAAFFFRLWFRLSFVVLWLILTLFARLLVFPTTIITFLTSWTTLATISVISVVPSALVNSLWFLF
jgi:hypothetical protein